MGGTEANRDEILRRLQRLEDIEAIRALRNAYHRCYNEGRLEEMAELFSEDAVVDFDYFGSSQGRSGLREYLLNTSARSRNLVRQIPYSHDIKVDGDVGSGTSYLLAFQARFGESYVLTGSYEDKYVRVDGKWYIQEMRLRILFSVPLQDGWAGDELHHLHPENVGRRH